MIPAMEPLTIDTSPTDDGKHSRHSSPHLTPVASPSASNGTADTGLPPTPPSNARDEDATTSFSPPEYADRVVNSLRSKDSSLSTPVNQRSPPTPDPSPPRTTETTAQPRRPPIFAIPSSRAESFKTAREEPATDVSRSSTPMADRLSNMNEEPGLGMAFEREDSDATPTMKMYPALHEPNGTNEPTGPITPEKNAIGPDDPSEAELDPHVFRNVTVRKKRNQKSPQKNIDALDIATSPVVRSPLSPRSPRSPSGLHKRIVSEGSPSPHPMSMEKFAQSIGWPTEPVTKPEGKAPSSETHRHSGSSVGSTVVEAVVIVTPPKTRRTLRHSGKNLAYMKEGDTLVAQSTRTHSNRTSLNSDDIPLHRLVHKRASIGDRRTLSGTRSDTIASERAVSSLSSRNYRQDSTAYTLAHQESVRRVLQPAAMIMSRSNSVSRPYTSERSYHKRISSAPEPAMKPASRSSNPRRFFEPIYPPQEDDSTKRPSHLKVPSQSKDQGQDFINLNKSLPDLPQRSSEGLVSAEDAPAQDDGTITEDQPRFTSSPDAMAEPLAEGSAPTPDARVSVSFSPDEKVESPGHSALMNRRGSIPRGSPSSRGRSEERRRSSTSRDRRSASHSSDPRPSLDRLTVEELPRQSYEWRSMPIEDHRRVSFDRSTSRSEEHALARHLFAQTTPFSQFSDTPIEVSEATTVTIYPHNNHSLLVVQQLARSSTLPLESDQIPDDQHMPSSDPVASDMASRALMHGDDGDEHLQPGQPTLTVQPSTPPKQLALPVPEAVDSPLKNPRAAPEPPVIKFIPPTPAEELEKHLAPNPPGPPPRSDSHPQRRLSLVQRARRYSDNLISPLLARASSTRSSRSRHTSDKPHVPTVTDEGDGSLHPFWRPRGFWEGFDDSESDDDEAILPQGGDTSDIDDEPATAPEPSARKLGVLGRRLTNSFKTSGGFLIGNSLGVERSGTNKRRPHITLPSQRSSSSSSPASSSTRSSSAPKILIQRPTLPVSGGSTPPRAKSPRIEKRGSAASIGSRALERPRRRSRREAWRSGKRIPGVGLQVQYIGLRGVKERLLEKRKERRREEIRRSIGSRYFVEGGG